MTIQIDSREKPKAIKGIIEEFDNQGVNHFVSVCNNVCQDHKRFISELKRANECGIKLVFLIEHSSYIKNLNDVLMWKNPRLKESPLAVSGERLYKILSTIEKNYNTKFYFCDKSNTGKKIIELLGK